MQVDLIVRNAAVFTVDAQRPRASAFAVLGDRLVGVGDEHDFDGLTARRTIDAGGAFVVPGFNDAHNHIASFGASLEQLALSSPPVRSVADIVDAVAARAASTPIGGWVVGSGYDQNKLSERRHPTAAELDRVAPDHLVLLGHTSGHMCVVNSAVLDAADWANVTVPSGGRIELDAHGRPTGLLQEQAQGLVRNLTHPVPQADLIRQLDAATRRYVEEGLTSCTDAGIGCGLVGRSPLEFAAFQAARDVGALALRVTAMTAVECLHDVLGAAGDPESRTLDLGIRSGLGDWDLRLGPVKVFADGSLIGRTCAMFHHFADDEDNHGFFQHEIDWLRDAIWGAHRAGWQVATHAIGDRAVSTIVDLYEEALARWPRPDARHRIEHCGVCRDDDVERMARLGIIPVPQARFISEIGDGMMAALGPERTAQCYRQRSFLDAGLVLPGSSDRPVVQGAPLLGIHDLVNQRTAAGVPFAPQEALSAAEAITAYTLGSAYAERAEHHKGSLVPGKLADFTVLDRDLTACDPEAIAETRVLATIVGGEARFD
ncbi:MAG: amidohydrolase, partial [Acidimicrobiia bacterium]|nr:amidohydrolase [Acidimicrobiia bacterium]